MCPFRIAAAEKQILQAYAAELAEEEEYKRNWNIAPTDTTLVITSDQPNLLQPMHFGLVPHTAFSTQLDLSTTNARKDRLLDSKIWSPLIKHRKTCLVLTSGYYEWKKILEGRRL